jgi:uncharacterized membrane protein
MTTKPWAMILMVVSTLATASAQLLYKYGLVQEAYLLLGIFIFFGLFLYGVGALLISMALKGGDLSALYPIMALSYVFVTFGSKAMFGESFAIAKWVGIIVIILGVTLISYGGHKW